MSRGEGESSPAPLPGLFSDAEILERRGPKNIVDPFRPYAYLVEEELSRQRRYEPVATLFLTNKECPLRCTMCDLWKNTLDSTVPVGAIPAQIDYALERLGRARHIKLYNSGNFFDPAAIPTEDHEAILQRTSEFETIIVENHPRFCNRTCFEFQERSGGRLEVALGLETIHPESFKRLNKKMELADFKQAAESLRSHGVSLRVFLLLQPPFCGSEESVEWCRRSMEFAFEHGVDCCSLIPTRGGNGTMEWLQREGWYERPTLLQMEEASEAGLRLGAGRVFMDLWDVEQFSQCSACAALRIERIAQMNRTQEIPSPIQCDAC